MILDRTTAVVNITVALIAGGLLSWARDLVKTWRAARDRRQPSARDAATIAEVDASLVVVAKARDELEEDNRRIRLTLSEERHAHAEDRARWEREKALLRGEIDALESKLRGLLAEVEALRSRTTEAT